VAGQANGDFAVLAHTHGDALAPDVGPPGTGGDGAEDGALFGQGLVPGSLGRGAQFAVDFMSVGVGQELVEQAVGALQFQDAVSGQPRREALLPVVVAAFDFAFGLGRELHPMQIMQSSFSLSRIRFIRGAAGNLN
jgi:hypothetical protein